MKKHYTAKDVAALYGVHVQTVLRWIREGQLGAIRIGGRYHVRQSDIDAMEARLAVNTTNTPAGMAWT